MDQVQRHLAEDDGVAVARPAKPKALQQLPAAGPTSKRAAAMTSYTSMEASCTRKLWADGREASSAGGGRAGQRAAVVDGPLAPLLPTGPGLVLDELACELWAGGCGDGGGGGGAAAAGPGAACGNPLCTGGPGQAATPRRLLVCGGCRSVAYCSRACAQAMWPRAHRFSCARLAARRAAGAGVQPVAAAAEQQEQQLGRGAGVAEPAYV